MSREQCHVKSMLAFCRAVVSTWLSKKCVKTTLPFCLHPSKVSKLTSQVARLSKERDSALSKMGLWMKTCKQVEQEKQALLDSPGVETHLSFLLLFDFNLKSSD